MKSFRPFLILVALTFLAGCAAKTPHTIVPDFSKRGMKLIAVMPVNSSASDPKSAEMLRSIVAEELYFKGYPRIPFNVIDASLAGIAAGADGKIPPQSIGERLKVDAVLYTTVHESGTRRLIVYAPTTVDLEYELRSTKTGEGLWRVRYRTTKRNYGFTKKQLELKSSQIYEATIHEVMNRALGTLPDSLDGVAPSEADPKR
jgi:hypothetical protein